jgi:hypothetical protein
VAKTGSETEPVTHKGKLQLDATCAPADIRYPSDLSLLNDARENLEEMIDELWHLTDRVGHKTDYSRKKAHNGDVANHVVIRNPLIQKAVLGY